MLNTAAPVFTGLTTAEADVARRQYGANVLADKDTGRAWALVKEVVAEPMFLLLAVACGVYGLLGEWQEAAVLGAAMLVVAGISVYQTVRSDRALQALRQLSQPTVQALRNGELVTLAVADVVVGDVVLLSEGQTVPADGQVLQANDCTVDESVLTGESVPVSKMSSDDKLFAGTLLTSGSTYARITAVGAVTELGRIGRSLETVEVEKTPLQLQIQRFVSRMAIVGIGAFALIWGINFALSGNWIASLLFGLTIAMAVVPEEIPVAFSSFMALGAARMVRFGVLTKQPQTVESLGSATVICTDKTGTLTQDGMAVAKIYDGQSIIALPAELSASARDMVAYARWASEPEPFDPMEKAILATYQIYFPASTYPQTRPLEREYALEGSPPMMTHVYAPTTGPVRVAAKGAVERIVRVCRLPEADARRVLDVANQLAAEGYRVLGVAGSDWPDNAPFPHRQDDYPWTFNGLVALDNPPKANARAVIERFGQAGIAVKMITGDSPETARAIAAQLHLSNTGQTLTGQQVMTMPEVELRQRVGVVSVFARMFPEAKLNVIRALKANGEVVAMTGDGVNDGPALKAAHIGVAMGRRGTEIAKQAASLVLTNDDLGGMVDAIEQGRRIYQNLKKAIGYIVSIHIPIILTVVLPLVLGWKYLNLFSPVHVIFLELVMGPTCSIAFENEPADRDLMRQPPRPLSRTFFTARELGLSIVQGLAIALATLGVYYVAMQAGRSLDAVRTMTFVTLVMSNIFLTLVTRSGRAPVWTTLGRPNALLWIMLGLTLLILVASLLVPGIQRFAQFEPVSLRDVAYCAGAALLGTFWFELTKVKL